jgi:hypothetical protein
MVKLSWIGEQYSGATLRFGDGLITIVVDWALVSKGEEGYYYARINNLKLKKKFNDMPSAKAAGVAVAFRLASLATEQLKNFVEG